MKGRPYFLFWRGTQGAEGTERVGAGALVGGRGRRSSFVFGYWAGRWM